MNIDTIRRERPRSWLQSLQRSAGAVASKARLTGRYRRSNRISSFQPGVLDSPAAAGTLFGAVGLLGSVTTGLYAWLSSAEKAVESGGYAIVAAILLLVALLAFSLRRRLTRTFRHVVLLSNILVLQALIVMAPELSTAIIFGQACVIHILMAYSLLPVRHSLIYPPLCIVLTWISVATHAGLTMKDIVIAVPISALLLTGLHWIAMSALTSETDALTRIDNRRGFKRRLDALLCHEGSCTTTIAVIDLDHFAVTNETLTAVQADAVLVDFAQRCRTLLPNSAVVCRIGGDEFALLLPECSTADAAALLNALRPLVHAFSAGVAASEAGESASEMITHAQDALHVAKRSGRGVTRVHGGHYAGAAVVAQAIAAGEFFLEFQPVVDLRTRRVVGAEALVRWQHPTRGRISPEDFIPLCESSGSIVQLGQWVLSQALLTAATWRIPAEPGHADFFIGVNAAGQEFADPYYAERALAACHAADLPPRALTIELTEGAYGIDEDVVHENLRRLQESGIPIAIDDFGTGFANLERLSRMQANTLKIDRRFVADIRASEDDAPLVEIIIGLAAALNNDVIAEGVETEEQAVWLEEHGCLLGQGYLFSRPVAADAFVGACAAIPGPQQ